MSLENFFECVDACFDCDLCFKFGNCEYCVYDDVDWSHCAYCLFNPCNDDNYEDGTDKDFDTHFEDVLNGNGYYDEDGKYRSYGYSNENY